MKTQLLKGATCAAICVLAAGCATAPVVEPTAAEREAARQFKKTVAVIEVTDDGSPIRGVDRLALSDIENLLIRNFNVVERAKIRAIMKERSLGSWEDVERINEIGRLLGADFLVFGNVAASVSRPELRYKEQTYESGDFRGSIWKEQCGVSEVSLKMVSVSSGEIYYADKKTDSKCNRGRKERYRDQEMFERDLKNRKLAGLVVDVVGAFNELKKKYSLLVSKSLDETIEKFSYDLRNKFAQSGQIMDFISANEVVVNLGSAYGLRPGDRLIVFREGAPMTDPKTGLTVIPKEKKGTLKVTQITSGLSCVAKGSAGLIRSLRIGDVVFTH